MIERMTKYSFILLSSAKDAFLEDLQSLGLVDITRSSKPIDEHSAALLDDCDRIKKEIKDIEAGTDARLRELENSLSEQIREQESLRPWGTWDRARLEETGLELHFYNTAAKNFDPDWPSQYAIQKVSEDGKQLWFVIVGSAEGFPLKEIPAPTLTFAEASEAVAHTKKQIELYSNTLENRREELPGLRKELSDKQEKLSLYLASATGESAAENKLVIFEGFAPSEKDAALKDSFDKMPVLWLSEKAAVEDEPPIKFKNKKFVGMFEVLTDMYGRPAYDGFDPTPFISIFFTLFFAFCMGDAGYGLVIVLLGLLLRGKLGKQTSALVMTLGVATFIIGFIFHTFFSMDISQWGFIRSLGLHKIMVPENKFIIPGVGEYDWTMILAIACGVVHISLAQLTKAIVETRNKGFLASISTWGWTLLIVGGVIVGTFALIGVFDKTITKIIIIVIGIISALFVFFLRDFKKNPLINVGNGLWETYNTATGLLSDVLSYLRLYALGLAGGLLGAAFNDLAIMVRGDGGIGWIFFVLLLIVGHVLNIAMCALGAFVHPLRLNFLEFFKNAGYEGAGRKYTPLAKENTNN
jgi:V/A-type H+-transporting ATPase subunit I